MPTGIESPSSSGAGNVNDSSLERLIPDQIVEHEATGHETLQLHLQRYRWASETLRRAQDDSRLALKVSILDSACGAGYGSALLAKELPDASVLGIDIDTSAVDYALQRYGDSGAQFKQADLTTLAGGGIYDAIVSLETVEHVPDPKAAITAFRRLITNNGIFVSSVPVTPSVDVNPYHVSDFSRRSFLDLLRECGFEPISEFPQTQAFSVLKIARGEERRLDDMRQNLPGYYLSHPQAALSRLWSTLRYGFTNRYLTVACRPIN